MMPSQILRMRNPSGASSPYIINMEFELPNGSTTFPDTGSGASVWVRDSTNSVTCQTATVLAGTASMGNPNTNGYIETPYTSANRMPATGNWDLSYLYRASSNLASAYQISVQDAVGTASLTAIAVATNISSQLGVTLSDGVTRSQIIAFSAATQLAINTTYQVLISRRGSVISLSLNGVQVATGAFAGSINFPVGQVWRVGKPNAGLGNNAVSVFDNIYLLPVP